MIGTFIDPSPLLKNLTHHYEMINYARGSGNGGEKADWSEMAIYKKIYGLHGRIYMIYCKTLNLLTQEGWMRECIKIKNSSYIHERMRKICCKTLNFLIQKGWMKECIKIKNSKYILTG